MAGRMALTRHREQPSLRLVEDPPRAPDAESLTPREVEILRLAAKGLCNREIAEICQVSEGTVRTHVRNVLGKLGVNNRVKATLYALRDGLTTLEECLAPQADEAAAEIRKSVDDSGWSLA